MSDKSKFGRALEAIGIFILIVFVAYAFLSLCNWSIFPKDWNGFSRFVLAAVGIVSMLGLSDY